MIKDLIARRKEVMVVTYQYVSPDGQNKQISRIGIIDSYDKETNCIKLIESEKYNYIIPLTSICEIMIQERL